MNGGSYGSGLFVLKSPIVLVDKAPISNPWAASSAAVMRFRPSGNVALGLNIGGDVTPNMIAGNENSLTRFLKAYMAQCIPRDSSLAHEGFSRNREPKVKRLSG